MAASSSTATAKELGVSVNQAGPVEQAGTTVVSIEGTIEFDPVVKVLHQSDPTITDVGVVIYRLVTYSGTFTGTMTGPFKATDWATINLSTGAVQANGIAICECAVGDHSGPLFAKTKATGNIFAFTGSFEGLGARGIRVSGTFAGPTGGPATYEGEAVIR
ncbi:MAG: hypothetical protein HYS52_02180 [Candidatus Wildermuthbacteria bacterium]|nr:hypothetical protein [Candidatus Wildermuthbacteria bacterium]